MSFGTAAALAVLILTYSLMAVRSIRGHRVKIWMAAAAGGILMLAVGALTPSEALEHIDFSVIFLLTGMMALVASLEYCGFFEIVVNVLLKRYRGGGTFLKWIMVLSAGLSAVMLNDAVVLIFAPIVLRCCRILRSDPVPCLVGVFVSANIGSAATVVGNPQNALIASYAGLDFVEYSLWVIPLVVLCMAVAVYTVHRVYRSRLGDTDPSLPEETSEPRPVDRPRLIAVSAVAVTAFILFSVSGYTGIGIHVTALAAGAVSLLIIMTGGVKAGGFVAKRIDWSVLVFFIGLFVVMGGAVESGLMDSVSGLFGADGTSAPSVGVLAVLATVLSNLVSNVPAVMLLSPFLSGGDAVIWTALAVFSTFAGNLTLIGAAANVIAADEGEKYGVRLDFVRFLKVGIPVTVATVAIATAYFYALQAFL